MDDMSEKIDGYRSEEPIVTVLASVSRPQFVIDETIHRELQTYFLFANASDKKSRTVMGPADYNTLIEILNDLQPAKERVSEILLVFSRIRNDLTNFLDIVRAHLYTKPEVMNAKNDAIRTAIVSKTVPELEKVLSKVKSVIESAEIVHKNCNQTYNICNTMSNVIKEMLYYRSLANPPEQESKGKLHKQL